MDRAMSIAEEVRALARPEPDDRRLRRGDASRARGASGRWCERAIRAPHKRPAREERHRIGAGDDRLLAYVIDAHSGLAGQREPPHDTWLRYRPDDDL